MSEVVGPATSADEAVAPVPPPELVPVQAPLPPQPELASPKPEQKVYTDYSELQADYFPEKFECEGKQWRSQQKDLVVLINKSYMDIAAAIPFKDRMGKVTQLNQIFFGGYKIKFDGYDYISKNKLEELSLEKQPKVICFGLA